MIIRPIPFKLCALCLLLASCAVPNSGAVDEISTSDIPFGLNSPETSVPATTTLQGVFAALVAGLPDSMNAKVKTVLPVDFAAVIDVEGGVANVNAKRVYLDSIKPNEQRLAIAQIVLTLTSQPGIGQVTFSVGGKAIGVPRGRGDIAGAGTPVTFDDYKMLIAK